MLACSTLDPYSEHVTDEHLSEVRLSASEDWLKVSEHDIRHIGRYTIAAMRAAEAPDSPVFFGVDLTTAHFPAYHQLANVVVQHRSKLLMLKRRTEPFAGKWSIPGGQVEANEAYSLAARRELAEEADIVTDELEPLYVIGSHELQLECHLWRHRSQQGYFNNAEPKQHSAMGWLDRAEALGLDLTAGVDMILKGLQYC